MKQPGSRSEGCVSSNQYGRLGNVDSPEPDRPITTNTSPRCGRLGPLGHRRLFPGVVKHAIRAAAAARSLRGITDGVRSGWAVMRNDATLRGEKLQISDEGVGY